MSNGKCIVGVEWLGQCYDAVKLDPLALNGSFKSQGRVFHVQADGPSDEEAFGYRVPVGVLLRMTNRTEIRTTSQVIYDAYDYRTKMSRELGASASFEGLFELSASASSKAAEEKTASGKQVMKFSMMTREHQRVTLRETSDPTRENELDAAKLRPLLSKAFAAAVRELPAQASEAYESFIATFGTHFAAELTLGGVAYEELLIDETEISEGKLSESTLEAVAKLGLEGFEAGASAKSATEEARKKDAQYKVERSEIKFIGGKGGTEIQTSWIAEVDEEPSPIFPGSKFARLTAALTRGFFPDDPQIEAKRQLLDDAIDQHIVEEGAKAGGLVRFGDESELVTPGGSGVVWGVGGETLATIGMKLHPTLAKISLEPATDDDHEGAIVYTGRARPVRIRVVDQHGVDRGYLERDAKLTMDNSSGDYLTHTTRSPDPERSRWILLPVPSRPGLRPLVRGEPVSVHAEVAGEMLPVREWVGPGTWSVLNDASYAYGEVVRFNSPSSR